MLDLGFSRGYGIHPQDHAGHPPHAAVLGDLAARHRRAGEALSATGLSRRGRGRRRRPCRYRVPGDPDCRRRCRARGRQRAALLRIAERAGVLQHAGCGAAFAGDAAGARFLRGRAVGRTDPERANPGAAGVARRTRARLRRHRRGGARHRPAEPRPRHSRRSAERRRGHAASLRPHRPRRPQGRQRPAGAAGAKAARRIAAEPGRHRRRLGHGAAPRKKSASSIRSACCRMRCSPKRRPPTIWCWRRHCSPSARPRTLPRRWRGSIARGCLRPRIFSIPARAPAARATSAAGKRSGRTSRRRSRRRTAREDRQIIAASRHGGGQRLVSRRHRTQEERGSALAAADDLPSRRHRQA